MQLYPYVGVKGEVTADTTSAIFYCPVAQAILPFGEQAFTDRYLTNYTVNGAFMANLTYNTTVTTGSDTNPLSSKISELRAPSQSVLVFDGASRTTVGIYEGTASIFLDRQNGSLPRPGLSSYGEVVLNNPVARQLSPATSTISEGPAFAFRHNGGTTMHAVMADSSVRKFKRGELLNRHILKLP